MKTLRIILGDQLSQTISALQDIDPAHDVVLMMEVEDETTYVRHHKQKIVLVISAMRHFAERIRAQGITVDYVRLDEGSWPGAAAPAGGKDGCHRAGRMAGGRDGAKLGGAHGHPCRNPQR